jgi:hemerythrin superfamily protein
MAKSFGSFREKQEIQNQGKEYIQDFWKYVKIDVETLVKKMDVDHPNKWESLDYVVRQLTNIQQMRDSFKRRAEEALNEEKSKN